MPWINSSSPQLMFSCYPFFCGTKPKCVEQDGLGGVEPAGAWGFQPPLPTMLTPTNLHTHTQNAKLRDLTK